MSKFKLLSGSHTQKEVVVDEKGNAVLNEDGTQKLVPVAYHKGDVFDSDHDLAAMFNQPGCVKFEAIGEGSRRAGKAAGEPGSALDVANKTPPANPSVSPGGQVSTGFQKSTSLPDGTTVSGPLVDEEKKTTRVASLVGEGSETKGAKKGEAKAAPAADEWSVEELDALTIPELKEKAAKHDVDLKDAHLKHDIVKALHKGGPKSGK